MKITPLRIVGSTLSSFGQHSVRMLGTMIGTLLVVTALSLTAQPSVTSADGLVGHWKFDEGFGLVAADSSGFGNHGRLLDGPVWWRNLARPPFVLLFDGVNDHVNVGNSPSLNPSDEITLSAWVTPFSLSVSGEIIAKSNGTDPQYYLRIQAGGKIRFGIGGTVLNGNTALSPSAHDLHLVAGTYDGSTMKIYVDGVLDAVMSRNGLMHDNGVDVWIGCRHFQNPLTFSGLIDDPRIYSRALDATEIQSLVTPGTVVITSPAIDRTFLPGDPVTITADVFNFSAPVTKVDFYEGSTLIGTATQAPYSVVYYNPFIDNSRHYIVAVATDTAGNTVSSVPGAFWFNFCDDTFTIAYLAYPSASVFTYGDPILISVGVYDPCGTFSDRAVDFYDNGILLAHHDAASASRFDFVWQNAPPGHHQISARLIDSNDNSDFLTPVDIIVVDPNNPVPANDDFANSFDLAQITTGNNVNATPEPGEPSHNPDGASAGHSVWWHWTAPSDGWVFISTEGSSFDTVVAIYIGNNLGNNFPRITWNNEGDSISHAAIAQFFAAAGTTYQIAVDGVPGAWGDIQLNVRYDVPPTVAITSPADGAVFTAPTDVPVHVTAPGVVVQIQLTDGTTTFTSTSPDFDYTFLSLAVGNYTLTATAIDNVGATATSSLHISVVISGPANDDFANSFDLAQITTGNNVNATRESGEPSTPGPGHSVWWHYTAPSDGWAVFSTVGSSVDTGVAIYSGNTLDNLSLLGWNYDFNDPQPAIIWFNLIAGTTYQISVDDLGGAGGDIQLNVHYDAPPTFDITSPTDGAVFTAPADVPVHVTAQDPDGSVAKIELSLIGLTDDTTTTFTGTAADLDYTFHSLAAGNYQLIVRVTDNLGIMIPNSVVFTVQ